MSRINFKNESVFFLKSFWTNGFLIWSAIMGFTGIFSYLPLVCEFREALWFNQLMWVFFVPMIYQIVFRRFNYYKPSEKLKASTSQLKTSFVYFVLAVIISSVIIEYAYFVVETLLIIPEHHEEAQGSNYGIVPWLKAGNCVFIVLVLAADRYRKHLVQTGDVLEIKNEYLGIERQIFFLSLGFTLSFSMFLIVQTITNAPLSDFCQTLDKGDF